MSTLPASLATHRVRAAQIEAVCAGAVRYAPVKSIWTLGMFTGAIVGGSLTFTWSAVLLFVTTTIVVLLFGHSLGNHRKLVHDSFQCPKWLEYALVYCGVQVGLAGPIGLLRQHELRDYAQRLPQCHAYLRHGSSMVRDAWWQLNCELILQCEPTISIEARIAQDRFLQFLERTWMAQHLPWAVAFWLCGGWAFVFWGVCARVSAGVFGHWIIGYLAHNHGDIVREVRGAARDLRARPDELIDLAGRQLRAHPLGVGARLDHDERRHHRDRAAGRRRRRGRGRLARVAAPEHESDEDHAAHTHVLASGKLGR